jgi:hypothetical protein
MIGSKPPISATIKIDDQHRYPKSAWFLGLAVGDDVAAAAGVWFSGQHSDLPNIALTAQLWIWRVWLFGFVARIVSRLI